MTLKEILDAVLLEAGLSTYTAYADSTDDAVLRLLYLANRSIDTLRRYPWQVLRKTHEFTLTTDTTYPLPDDWQAFIPDTIYSDSTLNAVDFPSDEADWAYLQSSNGGSSTDIRVRLLGGNLEFYQVNSGDTVRVEYLMNTPVLATDGTTYKQRFTADTDTTLLDDDLVIRDILWRYKKLVGLQDWQADLGEFRGYERTLKGQESGAKTIWGDVTAPEIPYYNVRTEDS